MIQIVLPFHLRNLAQLDGDLYLPVDPPTVGALLDALESRYPVLRGAIRDRITRERRPYVRFFAAGRDLSHDPVEAQLPAAVIAGGEAFYVVGAIAGGR